MKFRKALSFYFYKNDNVRFIGRMFCYTEDKNEKGGLEMSLQSMESRYVFMEMASKRCYDPQTMSSLYALIASSSDKDAACREIADLMAQYPRDEDLLFHLKLKNSKE